ncbi:hypothetical protein F5880DRAFT_1526784 [Lentinula raphanica]|nr:hypothetical protein F5880DRAFT_1526784 [Lentinula raphanica]
MPCSTVSQALTILLIGVAIAPGILAAPTPTLPRSFDRQGSLSGDQTQGVDMLQSRRVDYANIGPQQDAVDQTEQELEHDQAGRKDNIYPDSNISVPDNLEERVILVNRGSCGSAARKKDSRQVPDATMTEGLAKKDPCRQAEVSSILQQLNRYEPQYERNKQTWDAIWGVKRVEFYRPFIADYPDIDKMAEVAQKAIDLGVPYSLEKLHSYIKLSTDIKHALANTDKSITRGPATESGDVEVGNSNSVARDPETEPGDVEVGKGDSVTTRGSETESGDVELGKGNSIATGQWF